MNRGAEPSFESFRNSPYWEALSTSMKRALDHAADRSLHLGLRAIYPIPSPVMREVNEAELLRLFGADSGDHSQTGNGEGVTLSMAFLELLAEAERARKQLEPEAPVIDLALVALSFAVLKDRWRSHPYAAGTGPALYKMTRFDDTAAVDTADNPKHAYVYVRERRDALQVEHGATPRGTPQALPTLHNDKAGGTEDVLGLGSDAEALAKLILLKKPGPPLAIGLFGDWGSGKSTFMERIEQETGRLAEREREATIAAGPEEEIFVQNVAQIRFNAWHYAEADLWSSIAAHIFRSLFDAAHDGPHKAGDRPSWLNPQAFKKLLEDLTAAKAGQGEARAHASDARDALAKARVEAGAARRRRDLLSAAKDGDMDAALSLLSRREDLASLDDLLRGLGLAPAFGDARRFVSAARTLRTTGGRFRAWLSATVSTRGLAWIAAGTAGGVATALVTIWAGASGAGPYGLPVLTGALASLEKARRAITPILKGAADAEAAADAAADASADTLTAAERARDDAETRLAQAERRRHGLEALIDADNPEAALNAFVQARLGEGGYHDRLGVVSRLHEDFRSLSELLARIEDKRQNAAEAGPPEHLQRIVLYIDDLDRCRDDTVIKVLEAVHLLLALPLFAVVVGVDARWLEGALSRAYKDQLGEAGAASPSDYLEKIFQLPYWLPKLDTGNDDRSGYSRLIDALAGARPDAARQAKAAGQTAGAAGPGGSGGSGEIAWRALDTMYPPDRDTQRRAVELTDAERACMKALGPLVGKSPRAVKRFMNSYLFIKARMGEAELAAFLGGDGGAPALFPASMLLLAIDIGLHDRSAKLIRLAIDIAQKFESAENSATQQQAVVDYLEFALTGEHNPLIRGSVADALKTSLQGSFSAEPGHLAGARGMGNDVERFAAALYALTDENSPDGEPGEIPVFQAISQLRADGALPRLSFRRPY